MYKKLISAALLLCAVTGVQALQAQPPSPRVDKPVCNRAELEVATHVVPAKLYSAARVLSELWLFCFKWADCCRVGVL